MNVNNAFEGLNLPRSLMEDITNSLRDAIIEGRLQPGQQIVEKELQKTLGVSRAPIREALLKLEGQGLVDIIPRKGSFVRTITARFIQENFIIRAWLEGLAARLCLQHLKESDYDNPGSLVVDNGLFTVVVVEIDLDLALHNHIEGITGIPLGEDDGVFREDPTHHAPLQQRERIRFHFGENRNFL